MNPIQSITLTLRRRVSVEFFRLTDKVDIVFKIQFIDRYRLIE